MSRKKKLIPAEKIAKDIQIIKEPIRITFSFDFLDRYHPLFNMGDYKNNPLKVEVGWFLDLLDCLNDVSKLTRIEFKDKKIYDLHPVDWKNANANCPENMEQFEWWQFRINKSKGRIVGTFIENCFHIMWLDRHHNLTNSEGYGKEEYYNTPKSLYEQKQWELDMAYNRIKKLEEDNRIYEELLGYN